MELTPELVRKHIGRLMEADATVKSYTKHSKSGKTFTVSAHARRAAEVKKLRQQHEKLKAMYSKTLHKELASKSEYTFKSDKIANQMDKVLQKIHAKKPPRRKYGNRDVIPYGAWSRKQ
jgi:thymidylate synthase